MGTLDHPPAKIVRELMVALSLGTDPDLGGAWPCYYSATPDKPDRMITVLDTQGRLLGSRQNDGQQDEYHGIQVRVRSDKDNTGYAKARTIATTLDGSSALKRTVSIGSSHYVVHSLGRTGDVISLGEVDGSRRRIFTLNYLVNVYKL